jgi:thiosulfate/3-mercaptopyruvate sulfurtransferase
MISPLVSVNWLAAHLAQSELVILDASLRKDRGGDSQIAGTRVLDIDDEVCDTSSPLPHMLPSSEQFTRQIRALGVKQDSHVVVYDRAGIYSSPRARWMFQAMGHSRVAVLDGGFPAWIKAGLPVEPKSVQPPASGDFVARECPALVSDVALVSLALHDPAYAVIDARSSGRFRGSEAEPRTGLRAGHMPNAINMPFTQMLQDGHMRQIDELSALFSPYSHRKMIFSCGSGVTACIVGLAAELAGFSQTSVYDGSWSEWGLPSELPVVTEPNL